MGHRHKHKSCLKCIVTTLFGRSNEFLALKNAYDRMKDKHSFERIMVHGKSGTGKTTLVMALQEFVLADNGFFCSGKYFQYSDLGREPYSGIMTAFSDLCDLVLQSNDFNKEQMTKIQKLLEPDGNVLVNTVTNISPFLIDKTGDGILEESFNTFYNSSVDALENAYISFLRAMCSIGPPVVLFVDDIQWMDGGSKSLLKSIVQDTELQNFMLILASRNDEADSFVEDLYASELNAFSIVALGNLDLEHVNRIVSDYLRIAPDDSVSSDIQELCTFIARRTQGNPGCIKQLMQLLDAKRLLIYDNQLHKWIYNINTIQKNTMIPDCFAESLSKKVHLLDEKTQKILKLLSLLGYTFTFRMVLDFTLELFTDEDLSRELKGLLKKAVETNFIEETCDGYQFTHKKVQIAFQGIIEEEEQSNFHLTIGLVLQKRPDDVFKYAAAVHMNHAVGYLFEDEDECVIWAETNLRASKYCMYKYEYSEAVVFLRKGLSLLGDGEKKWSTNFDLTLEIMEGLAQLEFLFGNFDASLVACEEILRRANTRKSKLNALSIKINSLASTRASKCDGLLLETIMNAFDEIGIVTPRYVTFLHCERKVNKLRKIIDSTTDDELLALPSSTFEVDRVPSLLLDIVFHLRVMKKIILPFYTLLLAVEHSLEHGFSEGSIGALSFFGQFEISVRHFDRAYRVGNWALKLTDDHAPPTNAAFDSIYYYSCLLGLKGRFQRNDSLLFKPSNLYYHIVGGNLGLASVFGILSFNLQFWTGEHLKVIEKSMTEIIDCLKALNQPLLMGVFGPMFQLILNLRNENESAWEHLTVLTFHDSNSEEELLDYLSAMNYGVAMLYWCWKAILAFSFGFYKEVEFIIPKIDFKMLRNNMILCVPLHLYFSLTYYARYQSTGKLAYLRKARYYKRYLARIHSSGNPNAFPCLQIAEAVDFSLHSKASSVLEVVKRFDEAIGVEKSYGLIHLEALANERAGFALLEQSDDHGEIMGSLTYLKQAMEVCRSWGATAKYRWLREKLQRHVY